MDQANNTITMLADQLEALRKTVEAGKDAKVAGVPLDQTVINALLVQYTSQKQALSSTFAQLP